MSARKANRSLREAAQLDDRHVNAGDFGVVANLLEADPVFRPGAKVWLWVVSRVL